MSSDYNHDLKTNEKWCYNFIRLLLARQQANTNTFRLVDKAADGSEIETEDEYEIEEVQGEERGWKVRAIRLESQLPAVIGRAEGNVFHVLQAPVLSMIVNVVHGNVNPSAFVHCILAAMSDPGHAKPSTFTVSLQADQAAARTNNWCLEHDKLGRVLSTWFVFTDTQGDWLIKTTKTVKKAKDELYAQYPAKVGTQQRPATNPPKAVVETREAQQQVQRRGGGPPPSRETR